MFGFDLKSLIVGLILGWMLMPLILGSLGSRMSRKTTATVAA